MLKGEPGFSLSPKNALCSAGNDPVDPQPQRLGAHFLIQ